MSVIMNKRRHSSVIGAASVVTGFLATTMLIQVTQYQLTAWQVHDLLHSDARGSRDSPQLPDSAMNASLNDTAAAWPLQHNAHASVQTDTSEKVAITTRNQQLIQLDLTRDVPVGDARAPHPPLARRHSKRARFQQPSRQHGKHGLPAAGATKELDEDAKRYLLLPHSVYMRVRTAVLEHQQSGVEKASMWPPEILLPAAANNADRGPNGRAPQKAAYMQSRAIGAEAHPEGPHTDDKPLSPKDVTRSGTELNLEAMFSSAREAVSNGYRVPLILHQTGPSLEAVRPAQREFFYECHDMYAADGWTHKFWTDDEMTDFVRVQYPELFLQWDAMKPFIRKVDTARYLWMHTFGGVYLDMDGECLRPASSFFKGLPAGSTAWIGGYPEPFFMASTPGNSFWLFFVHRIFRTWRTSHVRDSSGPQGLQKGLVEWASENGGANAVRLFSMSDPVECQTIQPPGDVQLNVATWRWITPPKGLGRKSPPSHEHRIGFIPNQILDVTECKGPLLRGCQNSHCHVKPQIQQSGGLFVHHCMETWGGHKPEDVQHSGG